MSTDAKERERIAEIMGMGGPELVATFVLKLENSESQNERAAAALLVAAMADLHNTKIDLAAESGRLDWLDEFTSGEDAVPLKVGYAGSYPDWHSELTKLTPTYPQKTWRKRTLREAIDKARATAERVK